MDILNLLFKNNTKIVKRFISRGAIIVDVRTIQEWNDGHISTALHIPLKDLNKALNGLKQMNTPVIAHCKSGVRSAKATKILKQHGIEAVNGGGFLHLKSLLE